MKYLKYSLVWEGYERGYGRSIQVLWRQEPAPRAMFKSTCK